MKKPNRLNKLCRYIFMLSLFACGVQTVYAGCVAGSVNLRSPLYIVSVDANRLLTYQQLVGTVTKKAALRSDCVGYTSYTISGTQNLPYPDGTQLLLMGKNDFTTAAPAAIYFTVVNGSINKTVTASGAQTGINSDPFSLYLNSAMVMRVKQPWK